MRIGKREIKQPLRFDQEFLNGGGIKENGKDQRKEHLVIKNLNPVKRAAAVVKANEKGKRKGKGKGKEKAEEEEANFIEPYANKLRPRKAIEKRKVEDEEMQPVAPIAKGKKAKPKQQAKPKAMKKGGRVVKAKAKAPKSMKRRVFQRRRRVFNPFPVGPAPVFGFGFGMPFVPLEPIVAFVRTGLKEETPSQLCRKENLPVIWSQDLKVADFDVKLEHLKEIVPEIHEDLPLDDVNGQELINIWEKTPITPEDLGNWKAFGDYNIFQTKESMKNHLQTVVDYCEKDPTAGAGIKNKLRSIAKILREDLDARPSILIMLAQHGGVCNVMKEVAVNMAYSILGNNLKEYLEKQSLKSLVLRQLKLTRELIVEEMFVASGVYMNTHPLIGYRNGLSQYIGLEAIPDLHAGNNPATNQKVQLFYTTYSTERIVKAISQALNDKNRKIPYNTMVEWLQQNSPKEDPYEFLTECFDENGHFSKACILYVLHKLAIIE